MEKFYDICDFRFASNKVKKSSTDCKSIFNKRFSFLIKDETVHSTFSILVVHKDIIYDLKGEKLKDLQERFNGISHVIIDEYSMLSQVMLSQIDKRLRQATGKNDSFFGGINMILVEDPGQLLPVGGSPLYHYPQNSVLSAHGLNCYNQFIQFIYYYALEKCQAMTNSLKKTGNFC